LTKFSSLEKLHCQCVTAAAFTGSYLVLPRLINPLSAGLFLKIFENPLVVTMVIALWMIALAAFLYGRRKDKEDKIK
ncbi:Polycystic kidney disease protein 1-like 2, partial [Biomphalaria glabrata]